MLRVIEPCIKNPDLLDFFLRFYDIVLVDSSDSKSGVKRLTVTLKKESDIYRIKVNKDKGYVVFIRPQLKSLTKRALDAGADGVQVDSGNLELFKKGQLNLMRQYDVIVEINLANSDFATVRSVALWSTRYVNDVILSSCSSDLSQFWHHLSKFALLTSLGIEEVDAFHYVYISPMRIVKR